MFYFLGSWVLVGSVRCLDFIFDFLFVIVVIVDICVFVDYIFF